MRKKSKNTNKYKIGTKINYLTILDYTQEKTPKKVICVCDCGRKKEYWLDNIKPKPNARYTVSCGCKRSRIISEKVTRHGMYKTKFYKRWRSMFDRTNPSYICAVNYIGLKVCKRWEKFENFMKDMYQSYEEHKIKFGERQTTLDRINNYKGYNPKNCRWATQVEQANNKKPKI